jgi:RNA-directed DNA polymerase
MFVASQTAEPLGASDRLLEMILERRNMFRTLNQVCANKGAPGIDKMTVKKIRGVPQTALAQDQGGLAQ